MSTMKLWYSVPGHHQLPANDHHLLLSPAALSHNRFKMRANFLLLTGLLAFTNAFALPESGDSPSSLATLARGLEARAPKCPDVWTQVNAELNSLFLDGAKCNALARGAIRAIFHDCGSWDESQGQSGGCDGSLIVGVSPDVELDRIENRGLQNIAGALKDLAGRYNVTAADMIVFAGSEYHIILPLFRLLLYGS